MHRGLPDTLLSFVIPCYRSEYTIKGVVDQIIHTVSQREGYDYEIIAVNDFSPDKVFDVLLSLAQENERIKIVNFAKNFGKHAAMLAGYAHVNGEYVISLDDDGQDPVSELWKLVEPLEQDACDIASCFYGKKKENFIKWFGHNFYVWISETFLGLEKEKRLDNFFAVKRFVCQEVLRYEKPYPFIEGLLLGVTNRVVRIPMEHQDRADDKASGFTLRKSISLFMNAVTTFSVRPLRIASFTGVMFACLGFLYGITIIIRKLLYSSVLIGYSSLMAVVLFSSGVLMILLGIIGEYLGRIYICINNSPQYVVRSTVNIEDKEAGR